MPPKTETTYVPAYTPDLEVVARLQPANGPVVSALGAQAVQGRQRLAHDIYAYDLMNDMDDMPDPRESSVGSNGELKERAAAEGYVSHDILTRHPHLVEEIDVHYQPLLTRDFYDRHSLATGTPLSSILKEAVTRDDKGNFRMPKTAYIDLLADLGAYHMQEVAAFDRRASGYVDGYSNRLQQQGLGYVDEVFKGRVQNARIVLDDGFDTLARGGAGRHERFGDSSTIVIAPLLEEEQQATIMHEFGHLIEGDGLPQTFPDAPAVTMGLREALAEHIEVASGLGRDLQDAVPEEGGVYAEYREMLDLFCNGGRQALSIHDFVRTAIAEGQGMNQDLRDALLARFPDHPDMIARLNIMITNMSVAENTLDAEQSKTMRVYVASVREHYAQKQHGASMMQRFLRKFGVLKA